MSRVFICLLLLALSVGAPSASAIDVTSARSIPVLEGGRMKPLDTWCREAMLTIYDEETFAGMDPVETVLAMAFESAKWHDKNIIALSYRPHRLALDLEKDAAALNTSSKSFKRSTASYDELVANKTFRERMEALEKVHGSGKELNDEQKEDSRLYGRVATMSSIMESRAFHMIPFAGAPERPWMAPGDMEGAPMFAAYVSGWKEIGKAFVANDQAAFDGAVAKLAEKLKAVDAKNYANPDHIALEVRYNALRPFRTAATLYAGVFFLLLSFAIGASKVLLAFGLALLLAGGMIMTGAGLPAAAVIAMPGWLKASVAPSLALSGLALLIGFAGKGAKWLTRLAMLGLLVGWVLHTGGLGARVILSDRGPISNMFESMIYLGWGAVTFAIGFAIFHGVTYFGMAACAVAAVMLLSAENSFDPFISPLVPVLRSYWLWIHVQIIMLGYAGLAMAIAMGHLRLLFTLGGDAQLPKARSIDPILHRTIQLGSACLGVGIVLGGIWADYSWGRYWGWDPKETWALITFLCYMALLHGRFAGWLSGAGVALGTVLGIFPLLMTYYGVNFLLVGLHSYASAAMNEGATFLDKLLTVPIWLTLLAIFEFVLTIVCDAVLLRSGWLIAGTLGVQMLFFGVMRHKMPVWTVGVIVAQALLGGVAWMRRDQLLKSGQAARLVMLMGALLVLPGIMQSASVAAAAIGVMIAYAAVVGSKAEGAPAAVKVESDSSCSRCANDVVIVKVKKADAQVPGNEAVRAACFCEPCTNIFCGKCCGLSPSAAQLSFAKCPECEKAVAWATEEHQNLVKTRPEAQFQPDVA